MRRSGIQIPEAALSRNFWTTTTFSRIRGKDASFTVMIARGQGVRGSRIEQALPVAGHGLMLCRYPSKSWRAMITIMRRAVGDHPMALEAPTCDFG